MRRALVSTNLAHSMPERDGSRHLAAYLLKEIAMWTKKLATIIAGLLFLSLVACTTGSHDYGYPDKEPGVGTTSR